MSNKNSNAGTAADSSTSDEVKTSSQTIAKHNAMGSSSRIPESYSKYPETLMSNYDHTIEQDVAEEIKDKELYARYAGWNFCGYVWWEGEMWNCEVWHYGSWQKTVNAETLEEIMSEVSDEYGDD